MIRAARSIGLVSGDVVYNPLKGELGFSIHHGGREPPNDVASHLDGYIALRPVDTWKLGLGIVANHWIHRSVTWAAGAYHSPSTGRLA